MNLQYLPLVSDTQLLVYLYNAAGSLFELKTCSPSSPCVLNFAKIVTAGVYYLQILTGTIGSPDVTPFQIPIASLNVFGDSSLRSTNQLLAQTIAIAYSRLHRVFLSTGGSYVVTLNNVVANQYAYANSNKLVVLYGETALYTISHTPNLGALGTNAGNTYISWTFLGLSPGYYWIWVDPQLSQGSARLAPSATVPTAATLATYSNGWSYSLSYVTDRYQCPYDSNYPDNTGIFDGCLFPQSVSTFPCLIFNATTGLCQSCLVGYTLTTGLCLENNCTAGTYKHYGACYPLPANCLIYSPVLGCSKCTDQTYQIIDKVCTRIPLNCTGQTYYDPINYVCAAVSSKCATFNATNGQCLTCANASDIVVNGSCVTAPIIICANRQYVLNGVCQNINALCSTFVFIGGQCLSCIRGFALTNNTCIQISCPNRQVQIGRAHV